MAAKTKKASSKLSVPFYTKAGVKRGTLVLPQALFGQKVNPKLVAQAVRVYLARQRKAHAKTKTRGEVVSSTAKIYSQKGTGRARHGARSAPIFVGGGVAHGPRGIANYKLTIPNKMARKALLSVLSDYAQEGKIAVADLDQIEPKTKIAASVLSKINPGATTIICSGKAKIIQAARNIKDIDLVQAVNVNTYDVLTSNFLVFTKSGLVALERRFGNVA